MIVELMSTARRKLHLNGVPRQATIALAGLFSLMNDPKTRIQMDQPCSIELNSVANVLGET
jgi:hypothetical protein